MDSGDHRIDGGAYGKARGGELHLAVLDPGKIEDVIDEAKEVNPGGEDLLQVLRDLFRCEVGAILDEQIRVPDDGVQGCAELMVHVVQEGGLGTASFKGFIPDADELVGHGLMFFGNGATLPFLGFLQGGQELGGIGVGTGQIPDALGQSLIGGPQGRDLPMQGCGFLMWNGHPGVHGRQERG